jgi:Domain of unknown function (DUF3883)
LDLDSFTGLIESFVGYDENAWSELRRTKRRVGESHFAQRLVTGLAAERYFESVQANLPEFRGYAVQNTTSLGCGYDFRLEAPAGKDFLAVEVKGLNGVRGTLSLTPKEHEIATALRERFFLFVVRNFRESPFHEIFRNPLSGGLKFRKKERVLLQVSWLANI